MYSRLYKPVIYSHTTIRAAVLSGKLINTLPFPSLLTNHNPEFTSTVVKFGSCSLLVLPRLRRQFCSRVTLTGRLVLLYSSLFSSLALLKHNPACDSLLRVRQKSLKYRTLQSLVTFTISQVTSLSE